MYSSKKVLDSKFILETSTQNKRWSITRAYKPPHAPHALPSQYSPLKDTAVLTLSTMDSFVPCLNFIQIDVPRYTLVDWLSTLTSFLKAICVVLFLVDGCLDCCQCLTVMSLMLYMFLVPL